ncbi:MAG: hypothetical protein COX42_01350 [Parcubacteria group bacterium CG23_combo_of_CG06-09_8_20_14_all_35_6]|nr:MAG: hypothetical protein COX42_01350 [Parcubacteria group bacterium CG23_combo_of_CG06-09_8_20_14_all_35_6]
MPPILRLEESSRDKIIKVSRERYATPKKVIEDKITRWANVSEEDLAAASVNKKEPLLHDAQCANCKKWTKVVFKPDGKRPVYCKACLKDIQAEKAEAEKPDVLAKQEIPKPQAPPISPESVSLEEAFTKEPISFSKNVEKLKKVPETKKINMMIKEALKPKDQE